ncbi:MAG: phosphotransferase, partial [Chloroflexi bacterium]|nr:phosphotransferase [Chloroflexota bacterium]
YQQLSPNIPLTMPSVIAVVPARGDIWMQPFAPSKPSNHWSASWDQSDVEQTLTDLARLHARFWGKTDQLARQPWLAQPIGRDAEALLRDAQEGLEQIIADAAYDRSLTSARVHQLLALAQHYQGLLEFLEATPSTLLHGDAGFQNIAIRGDGGVRVWYDWQLSGVGPAALDLVTYLHPWAYPLAQPPLSLPEMVELYLVKLQREGVCLNKALFARQLDAAFIWRWLCQWAPLLGKYRARLRDDIRQRLYHVFARLQWPALARNQGLND